MRPAVKTYKSVRMFENPILEKFTHVHPLSPLVLFGPIITYFLWKASVSEQLSLYSIVSLGIAGFLTWTFVEYILHRYLFHFIGEGPRGERVHFILHGFHHDDANDPSRLVMAPGVSALLAIIFYTVFSALLGPVKVQPFFALFVFGYLCYDYIHFYVHFFTPKTRVGKFLKQYHMKHHYAGSNSRWGVSSPLWDYIFGTSEEVMEVKSEEA